MDRFDKLIHKMAETSTQYLLETQGYIFLKGVYDKEGAIADFNKTLNEFMTKHKVMMYLQKPMDMDEEFFYVNNTYSNINTYEKALYYAKPVIENRGAKNRTNDVGYYDIYRADKLFPNILEIFQVKTLEAIICKTTSSRWKFHRANIHISNYVRNPMGYHSDGLADSIRVLIYLSDLPTAQHGAPVFIKASHTLQGRANGIKKEDIKVFTAEKGDILIHYENGFHRKLPQEVQGVNGFICVHFTKA
jgi:hypothetical protein